MNPRLLIVTGLPGTGKTTLGRLLARRLGAPLLCKDAIKEPLMDALGSGDAAQSRRLSDASFAALFALARELIDSQVSVILEGNFRPAEHREPLLAFAPARTMQILCRIEETERLQRLAARMAEPTRHSGHRDTDPLVSGDRTADDFLDLPGERLLFDGSEGGLAALLERL